ncbi:MAG: PAS domain S-box protein, partial [Alphaproteobacteria bacterium]|nr:PAS domain S-box protein [Alphaproteobacteria bacterium]
THLTVSPVDGSRRYVSYRVLSFYPEFVLLVGRSQDMALRTWWHFVEVSVIGWISAVAAAGGLLLWLARVRRRQSVAQDRAESELRRNENFYRLMFQANPHPMYVADAETLEFLAVNDAMADRYGWSRAEFLGMTVLDIRPADDVPRLLAAIEERPMNESQTVVGVRHRIKNGAVIEAETTSRMVEIDGRRVLIVLVHDVTARNRMMESLRESEALLRRAEKRAQEAVIRLRLAARFGNVGLWDWDLASDEVYFSPEWKRQIGYEDDEIAGNLSEWETRLHPEDRACAVGAARAFIDSAERNGEYRVEFRLRHKDGSYRWILAQGALLRDESSRVGTACGTRTSRARPSPRPFRTGTPRGWRRRNAS